MKTTTVPLGYSKRLTVKELEDRGWAKVFKNAKLQTLDCKHKDTPIATYIEGRVVQTNNQCLKCGRVA